MCGIAGIQIAGSATREVLAQTAQAMADMLAARGPDDSGVWVQEAAGLALSHRRLSILDLSSVGRQPMVSASGRFVISFNGEIYNYRALRAKLEYPWRSQSDTEVILAALEAWGVEKTLMALNGMFAFAVWDVQQETLTLARDRMGEKPLYYGWSGDAFLFASELKAFRKVPGWAPEIDRHALQLFLRYSYVPAPHSIFSGIFKLQPGYCASLKKGSRAVQLSQYWSLPAMVAEQKKHPLQLGVKEAIDELDTLLRKVVSDRMVADVPLGAFLSGGVDSSLVVALMQAQSAQQIKTFTIGFAEKAYDESPSARRVAAHLGTAHTEIIVSGQQVQEVIPKLAGIYDEPFADSSQIPTFLVSQCARKQVTVALSGDGGDEVFGGYRRHVLGPKIWKLLEHMPLPLRRMAAKVAPAAGMLEAESSAAFYDHFCAVHPHAEQLVLAGKKQTLDYAVAQGYLPFAEWMMVQDALHYFPDDIMVKVDRASMAVSLETRTPFTDVELMAFAWRLPLAMKIREGKGKWLLRQLLYRYVPRQWIERPKAGFAAPIGAWLNGPLKSWAGDLLAPDMLRRQGFLDHEAVVQLRQDVTVPNRKKEMQMWNVLMFQAWRNTLENNPASRGP